MDGYENPDTYSWTRDNYECQTCVFMVDGNVEATGQVFQDYRPNTEDEFYQGVLYVQTFGRDHGMTSEKEVFDYAADTEKDAKWQVYRAYKRWKISYEAGVYDERMCDEMVAAWEASHDI